MKTARLVGILIVLLVVLGVIVSLWHPSAPAAPGGKGQVACTLEAKICPDGTAVGRSGPNCEFAACPAPEPQGEASGTIGIGQNFSFAGVTVTPLEVLDDSRCPVDVQCVWAGTAHVKARVMSGLGTSEMTFALGEPVTTEAETITLTGLSPAPHSGTDILQADYRLTFEASKR